MSTIEAVHTSKSTPSALTSGMVLQRKCACGGSAGLSGECEGCKTNKLLGKPIQKKLAISEPGDAYEQEADRVAKQVVRMPSEDVGKKQPASVNHPMVQCRVSSGGTDLAEAPSIVHDVLDSPGQPFDAVTRAYFEPRFQHDFSHVRVHATDAGEQSARAVNAQAYTVGHDIVFGEGGFPPQTDKGRYLIAHELSHVVQQSGSVGPRESHQGFTDVARAVPSQKLVQRDEATGNSAPESCPFKEPVSAGVAKIIESELSRGRAANYDADELQTAFFHTHNQREVIANCCNAELAAAEHYFYSRYSVANHDYSPFEMKALVWGYGVFKFLVPRLGNCPKSANTQGSQDWGYKGIQDAERDLFFQNLSQKDKSSDENLMQAKPSIGTSTDPLELEADRVAERVIRMSPAEMSRNQNDRITRPLVQRRASTGTAAGRAEVPPIVHEVLNSRGQPLDPATRAFFEPRYGHDFSEVRVHTDEKAAKSARVVNALAYTVGRDVVFRAGQYALETMGGQLLLAHELAHVVQQSGLGGARSGEAHEAEAHLAADAVASDRTPSVALAARPSIARAPHNDRAFGGEQGMGFRQYSQQQGWQIIEGPSGSGGHNANASGFDAIAYNPKLDELHIVDNKSFKRAGNVASATAIDPARNLAKNLDDAIDRITGAQDIPNRIRVLELLRAARSALTGGTAIPPKVRLVVTGIGGNSSGITAALRARGVEFIPEGVPTPLPGSTSTNGSLAGGTQTPNSGTGNTPPPVRNTPEVLPNTGAAPKSNTPSTTAHAQVVPERAPRATPTPRPGSPRGAPRVFRMGMNAAKLLGPMILDMVNRYYMAKEEHARAVAAIEANLDSTDVTAKIDQLIEQNRLDIARRQHRGSTVYATVAVKVDFTNDVMNKLVLRNVHLSYVDESSIISTIMSHDGLGIAENKVWYIETSLPLDKAEVTKSESTQFDLDELDEKGSTTSMDPDELNRLNQRRNALLDRQRQEQRDEAAEKKRQLDSAAVIPDAKKRTQQQAEIVDALQKIKPSAAAPAPAPKNQGSGAASPGPFLPPVQQQPAGPSLLAPNDGPIQIAAKKVDEARAWAQRLEKKGVELRARQSTANPPSEAERQAFFTEEQQFRLVIKYWMNYFKSNSRDEAVTGLGELIDRVGPKLAELRTHLGG